MGKNLSTTQKIDVWAMLFAMLFGLVMFILSLRAEKAIDEDCSSKSLRSAVTGLIALSAGMMTVGIAYFFCMLTASCWGEGTGGKRTSEMYFVLLLLIAISIIACSIVVLVENSKVCGGKDMEISIAFILGLNCIIAIGAGFGLYVSAYNIPAFLRGKGRKKATKSRDLEIADLIPFTNK